MDVDVSDGNHAKTSRFGIGVMSTDMESMLSRDDTRLYACILLSSRVGDA